MVATSWNVLECLTPQSCTIETAQTSPIASASGDTPGTTDRPYSPNAIAASATGAAKPTVADTQPARNPNAGWKARVRKLYSPLERGNIAPSSLYENTPHKATRPPTVQSSRMEKPDGISLTWKPRLVNTPTPIMSAPTIAVATRTETECPPSRSRLGQAGLPVSDAVMSVPSASRRRGPGASWCPPIQARLTSV